MSFDPTSTADLTQPDDDRDPTIVEAVARVARAEDARQRTAIPGVVQSFDAATQRATIQAGVQLRLQDGSTIDEPVFADVPVAYPGAGAYNLYFPLAAGDEALVVFAERSIDEWLARGGYNRVANDPRRFAAQDAVCIPGLRSAPNTLPANARPADAVTLSASDGSVRVEIRAGGVVTITANEVRLGDDSATFLSKDALVQAELSKILLNLTALNAAVNGLVPGSVVPPNVYVQGATATTKSKGV